MIVVAAIFLGMALGGLFLDPTNAEWVEATGTWGSGAVAFLAVVVAARSFIADRREHRTAIEAERQARAADDQRTFNQVAERASLVDLEVGHSGVQTEDGRVHVTVATYTIRNLSTSPIVAVNLWHPLYVGAPYATVCRHLPSDATAEYVVTDIRPTLIDSQRGVQNRLRRDGWISFELAGHRWYKACGELTATTEQPTWWGVQFEADEHGNSRIMISEETIRQAEENRRAEMARRSNAVRSFEDIQRVSRERLRGPGTENPPQG